MKAYKSFFAIVFFFVIGSLSIPVSAAPSGEPLRLQLQWTHQAQFAGYYVALEKGFYLARNLDVSIIPGGPKIDPMVELAEGRADFATSWLSTALLRRDQGQPLVHVTQIIHHSNLIMIAWKDSENPSVADLIGKKISIWEGDLRAPFVAWLKAESVATPLLYPQYYTVNLFLRKGVQACSAMYYNELHMLYQAGVDEDDIVTYFLKDYHFGFPEDGIYCMERTLRLQPESVAAFREATLDGWRYAAEHPVEALDITMKYVNDANVMTNRSHMKWMLEKVLASSLPAKGDSWKLGELSQADYERTMRIMQEQGILTATIPIELFTGGVITRVP